MQPPYQRWATEFPALTQSIADAAAGAGARLVYADNLSTYGPVDGPSPVYPRWRPPPGRVPRSWPRRPAAHRLGTLQVVIGRSSDYYGPGGANSVVGDILFGAAIEGKRAAGWAAWRCRIA